MVVDVAGQGVVLVVVKDAVDEAVVKVVVKVVVRVRVATAAPGDRAAL